MPVLNKKQLKDIKKQFKENNLKEDKLGVNKNIGGSSATKVNIRSQVKREMKKSVNISWNISTGDLVYVPDPNSKDEIVGLVVKQNANMTSSRYSNKSDLMSLGTVLVMTPRGKYLYQPSKLTKIYPNEE